MAFSRGDLLLRFYSAGPSFPAGNPYLLGMFGLLTWEVLVLLEGPAGTSSQHATQVAPLSLPGETVVAVPLAPLTADRYWEHLIMQK